MCNTSTKTVRSSNGYANILSHLRNHHPVYEELSRASATQVRVVEQRSVDIYRWVEYVVMERLPFSFCERLLARANGKMSTISRGTLKLNMEDVQACVEARIKDDLPDIFGLVLDGCSSGGRHYIAIFAVFSDTRSRNGSNSVSARDSDYYEDIDCDKRRYILLAFCPLDDEESLYDLMADTLSRYDKPWTCVAFMVGDNCSVNQCIGRSVGAVPMVGCASHRFSLSMKDYMASSEGPLTHIHALMKRLCTLKGRADLRHVTLLAPVLRNDTRWSSTYAMVKRYSEIESCIRTLDAGTLAEYDLNSLMLSHRESEKAAALLVYLERLQCVTKTLQRSTLTISGVRRLFDKILETYPEMEPRLSVTGAIVHNAPLETGLVKIQRNETLSASERAACATFRDETPAAMATADEESSIVKEAFKHRRVQRRVSYVDVSFVPATSNECERFFSAAKLQLIDRRKSMDVEIIEMIMTLSYSR